MDEEGNCPNFSLVPIIRPRLDPRSLQVGRGHDEIHPMPTDDQPDSLSDQPVPYAPPPETQRLIDELSREELIEARAMRPEDKVLAGQELFEAACRVTLAGIRNQNPNASEAESLEILRRRLEWWKKVEATS